MLLSMTGHGRAEAHDPELIVVAEIRAVNNRFLKTSIHSDLPGACIAKVEALVKQHVARGSLNLKIRHQWLNRTSQHKLDVAAIEAYQEQLKALEAVSVADLLLLPGVILENFDSEDDEKIWAVVKQAVTAALDHFNQMRASEGKNTADDLLENCQVIETQLQQVAAQAPKVVEQYSQRLAERIQQLLQKHDLAADDVSVVREVGIFADRVDISEEIVRLTNHIEQFRKIVAGPKSNGRKLDFLTQEMLRETNTIGSKANDSEIATRVVEIKTAIERIREQVQNVE